MEDSAVGQYDGSIRNGTVRQNDLAILDTRNAHGLAVSRYQGIEWSGDPGSSAQYTQCLDEFFGLGGRPSLQGFDVRVARIAGGDA